MTAPSNPPKGYYDDPDGQPIKRYWDGDEWTPLTFKPQRRWNWKRIANFASRSRRVELWGATGVALAASAALNFTNRLPSPWPSLLLTVIAVVFLWLTWGSSVNRLHDMGRSGLFTLLFFVPIANIVVGLWIIFAEGQSGPNKWGPPVA